MMRIHCLTAHYRGDTEQGIHFEMHFREERGNRFFLECERIMAAFDKRKASDAIAWLDGLGVTQPPMTNELGTAIALTLYWLERRGHIPSDDQNGVQWIGKDADNPHGPVLEVLRLDKGDPTETAAMLARLFPKTESGVRVLEPEDFLKRITELTKIDKGN